MSRLLYYLFLKPISMLPLFILYRVSDGMYWVFYRLIGYRKKVVRKNLTQSFPEKSITEIKKIESAFYRHFCDLVIESVRLFSSPEKELKKRNILLNPELPDRYFAEGKSILLIGGHFNNWETSAAILSKQVKHHVVAIYAPLSNPFFEKKIQESRGRFGMELLSMKRVKAGFEENKDKTSAFIFATDQSPTHSKSVHWTRFLNQPTAVLTGTERFAREYDYPILFCYIRKVKRGYYEAEFKTLEDHPASTSEGEITERHVRWLEEQIRELPQYWLWTHKRWKRTMKDGENFYQSEA